MDVGDNLKAALNQAGRRSGKILVSLLRQLLDRNADDRRLLLELHGAQHDQRRDDVKQNRQRDDDEQHIVHPASHLRAARRPSPSASMIRDMQLADWIKAMEEIAPPRYAESWDNVGLLVGDPQQAISGAMLAIDYTPEVS